MPNAAGTISTAAIYSPACAVPKPFFSLPRANALHSIPLGGPPGPRSRSRHSLAPIRLYLREKVSLSVRLVRTRFPIAHTSTVSSCSSVKPNLQSKAFGGLVLPGLEGRQNGAG